MLIDITDRAAVLEFANKAHAGQFRKNKKEPYISHPIAVAWLAERLVEIEFGFQTGGESAGILYASALTHDAVEDTDVTDEQFKLIFPYPVYVAVWNLTKIDGETYLDSVLRAKSNAFSRLIKMADNLHNASDLKEGSLRDKYRLSFYILSGKKLDDYLYLVDLYNESNLYLEKLTGGEKQICDYAYIYTETPKSYRI